MPGDDEDAIVEGVAVLNNPAARLRRWLLAGQARYQTALQDEAKTQQQHGVKRTEPFRMLEVWCAIWELDPDETEDRLEYQRRAIGLIQAANETRSLAEASANFMAPHALEYFYEIESAVAKFMETHSLDIGSMMSKVGDTGWQSLKMLDDLLGKESPQPSIDQQHSSDLIAQARALIDGLRADSTLTEQDRLDLIAKVREVEDALLRAEVTGLVEVVRAADGLSGLLVRLWLRGVDVMSHPLANAAFKLAGAAWFATQGVATVSDIAAGPFADVFGLPAPPTK